MNPVGQTNDTHPSILSIPRIDIFGRVSTIEKSALNNGQALLVRAATPVDAAVVLELLNRAGGESDNLLYGADAFTLTVEEEARHIENRAGDGPSVLLLGFVEGALVAVGSLESPPRQRLAHTAELGLIVAQSHWSQGVGAAMIAALVDHARRRSLTLVHLGVRADNEGAIRLYQRFGFVKSGLMPGFIRVGDDLFDDITMTLDLRPTSPAAGPGIVFREATLPDLPGLLSLYRDLHDDETPLPQEDALPIWRRILSDPDQCVILGEVEGQPVASCVLVAAANLTRGGRPWALIENVVTARAHRRKGYGLALLEEAKNIALCLNCYKIMLLTGRKDEGTLAFYRKAGYDPDDKTAFIQRLSPTE